MIEMNSAWARPHRALSRVEKRGAKLTINSDGSAGAVNLR
jgi:hypothetical protein